eukprot:4330902-Amphidinium_carterae.1
MNGTLAPRLRMTGGRSVPGCDIAELLRSSGGLRQERRVALVSTDSYVFRLLDCNLSPCDVWRQASLLSYLSKSHRNK